MSCSIKTIGAYISELRRIASPFKRYLALIDENDAGELRTIARELGINVRWPDSELKSKTVLADDINQKLKVRMMR